MRTLARAARRSAGSTRRARRWRSTRRSRTGSASRQIKWELEDLAFHYLEPAKYHQVQRMVAESRDAREEYLATGHRAARRRARRRSASRPRSPGGPSTSTASTRRWRSKGKDFNEIYDLIALRVIVDSVKDVLRRARHGALHLEAGARAGSRTTWRCPSSTCTSRSTRPSSGPPAARSRSRSAPRRCTAPPSTASPRTGATRRAARATRRFDERLAWLRQMLEWQTELQGPARVHGGPQDRPVRGRGLRLHPEGRRRSRCKRGSTPIDFAYAIHTEVGNHMRRREGQRLDRAARLRAADGRPHRGPDQQDREPAAATGSTSSRPPRRAARSATTSARRAATTTCSAGRDELAKVDAQARPGHRQQVRPRRRSTPSPRR